MDWEQTTKLLDVKLHPDNVQPPAQGKYGEYLFAWHVINEANRIFGFDGWSYAIEPEKVSEAKNQNGNHVVGYICKCSLTVGQTHRQDVGCGEGISKSLADAHGLAAKEAATDSLKRALRTFGNQFGLALYDKSKSSVGLDVETVSPEQVSELQSLAEQAKVADEAICKMAQVEHLADIPADWFDNFKERLIAKANKLEEN